MTMYGRHCRAAGANGHVVKDRSLAEVVVEIRRVLTGSMEAASVGTPDRVSGKGEWSGWLDALSHRECQVLQLIGEGLSNKEAATALGVSVWTVETYRERLKPKLGLRHGSELPRLAVTWANGVAAPLP